MNESQEKALPGYVSLAAATKANGEKLVQLALAIDEGNGHLKTICEYKEEQKQGDIVFRKKSTKHSWWTLVIALFAVYVSVYGADSSVVMWLRSLS